MVKNLLAKKEFAAVVGVSTRTIENWMRDDDDCLVFIKRKGVIRFDLEKSLKRLMRRTKRTRKGQ